MSRQAPRRPGGRLIAVLLALPGLVASLPAQSKPIISSQATWSWAQGTLAEPNKFTGYDQAASEVAGVAVRTVDTCGSNGCSTFPTPGPPTPGIPAWAYSGDPNDPGSYTYALVAEAQTDFGLNRVRAWTSQGCDSGSPFIFCNSTGGTLMRSSSAESQWLDDFTWFGPSATLTAVITFEGSWAGGAELSLIAGLFGGDGFDPLSDSTAVAVNCRLGPNCQVDGSQVVYIPGQDPDDLSGSFNITIPIQIHVQDGDELTFGVNLLARPVEGGVDSWSDSFNSVHLDHWLVPQGGSLQAASGHAYAIQVVGAPSTVPEPTSMLLAAGALTLMGARRRFQRSANKVVARGTLSPAGADSAASSRSR